MKRLLLAFLLLANCGASSRYAARDYDYSPRSAAVHSEAPAEPSLMTPAPSPPARASDDGYYADEQAEYAGAGPSHESSSGARSGRSAPASQVSQNAPEATPPAAEKPQPAAPRVVYQGYLKLRVKRLLDALDTVVRLTEKARGYVQSMTATVIVVRIPADDFEAVMGTFAEVGEVLSRRVQAFDVTAQFLDLEARLAVAKEARARLLALLESVQDVQERLRILQEVKRLTEQIESAESTLATLQNLVDYFTITLELVPVVTSTAAAVHRSPFAWVRTLTPHLHTLARGKDDVTLNLPLGFVLFARDTVYRAQAADTTTLRIGYADNEPAGDNAFWAAAVHHELEGRDEESVASGEAGRLSYRVYRSKDVRPRYYLVAVAALGKRVWVVETFFPDEAAYQTHGPNVLKALESFQAR